ncbi:MAG: hypothetical protein AB8B67_03480 [Rickettsiaceae bacterium]
MKEDSEYLPDEVGKQNDKNNPNTTDQSGNNSNTARSKASSSQKDLGYYFAELEQIIATRLYNKGNDANKKLMIQELKKYLKEQRNDFKASEIKKIQTIKSTQDKNNSSNQLNQLNKQLKHLQKSQKNIIEMSRFLWFGGKVPKSIKKVFHNESISEVQEAIEGVLEFGTKYITAIHNPVLATSMLLGSKMLKAGMSNLSEVNKRSTVSDIERSIKAQA